MRRKRPFLLTEVLVGLLLVLLTLPLIRSFCDLERHSLRQCEVRLLEERSRLLFAEVKQSLFEQKLGDCDALLNGVSGRFEHTTSLSLQRGRERHYNALYRIEPHKRPSHHQECALLFDITVTFEGKGKPCSFTYPLVIEKRRRL